MFSMFSISSAASTSPTNITRGIPYRALARHAGGPSRECAGHESPCHPAFPVLSCFQDEATGPYGPMACVMAAVLIRISCRSESGSGFFLAAVAGGLLAAGESAGALAERDVAHRTIQRRILTILRMTLDAPHHRAKQGGKAA